MATDSSHWVLMGKTASPILSAVFDFFFFFFFFFAFVQFIIYVLTMELENRKLMITIVESVVVRGKT